MAAYPIETVFKELLHGCFSMVGRLEKLAECFDELDHVYRHAALERLLGACETHTACAKTHELIWRDWIGCCLEQQQADLNVYVRNHLRVSVLGGPAFIERLAPFDAPTEEISLAVSNIGILESLLRFAESPAHTTTEPEISDWSDRDGVRADMHRDVLALIAQFHTDPHFSPAVIQEALGMSERQIARIVKAHTGMAFTLYVRQLRIRTAIHLLTSCKESVKTISRLVGYTDASWFIKYFRQATGMTPAEFRKAQNSRVADFA